MIFRRFFEHFTACGTFLFSISVILCSTHTFAATGDNVALTTNGSIATQSSYYSGAWPASNCTNGITASNRNAELCHSASGSGPNAWWDLELPNAVTIDSIVVHNRTNCCSNRILYIYVLVSDTPFPTGNDAASLSAAKAQASFEYQITSDVTVTTIPLNNLVGKHVRLQKAGPPLNVSNAYNLLEIQVFEGRQLIDLAITKSVSDSTPNIGDVITFSLEVTNTATNDATDFLVTDSLPAGFGTVTNISNGGTMPSSGQLSWNVPSLAASQSITLTFDALVLGP